MAERQRVHVVVRMSMGRMLFIQALCLADKIMPMKLTEKIKNTVIKRSIKMVPVQNEKSTTES